MRLTLCDILIWCFLLAGLSQAAIFPTIMEGEYAIENFYTVDLMVGTPPRSLRLAVNFSSTGITTAQPIPLLSRSYSPALGGSDVVHFDGDNIRVPLSVDGGYRAKLLGCSDCDGAIGIGAGANIWLYYTEAIFTAGSVVLDERLGAYDYKSSGKGEFECLPGVPNLCLTYPNVRVTSGFKSDKSVGRVSGLVRVNFGYPVPKTIVPPWLYHAFTQGRNVQKNPGPGDWPDLEFEVPTISGTGDTNKFVIRSEDLVTRSRRTGYDLLLAPGPDDVTVIIGTNAARSFMFKRSWHTGVGQVVSWEVRKHWSAYALVMMIVGSVLFVYWKLSPSAEWKVPGQGATYGPFWKILASFTGGSLLIITYALPNTQTALSSYLDFNVYIGAFIANMILWQIFGAALFLFGGSMRLLGYHALPITTKDTLASRDSLLRMGDGMSPHYTEDGPFPSAYPAASRIPQRYVYLTPRLWIVISVANESVLLMMLLLVFLETRTDTLGTFFTVILVFGVLFNMLYHMMIAFFVNTRTEADQPYLKTTIRGERRRSTRWSFTWLLFWVSIGTLFVVGLILAQIHIVQPFVERHVTRFPKLIIYTTAFAYGAGLLLAISWARQRVIYEEKTKLKLMQKYIKAQ